MEDTKWDSAPNIIMPLHVPASRGFRYDGKALACVELGKPCWYAPSDLTMRRSIPDRGWLLSLWLHWVNFGLGEVTEIKIHKQDRNFPDFNPVSLFMTRLGNQAGRLHRMVQSAPLPTLRFNCCVRKDSGIGGSPLLLL